MENMDKKVERMVRKSAKRRLWHRVVAIPAAVVVFVTTYALILPAIAMERDTYCGLETHQHTEECYTAELACGYEDGQILQSVKTVTELACTAAPHQHTEACFDENGAVICGYADYLIHEHNADCYNEQGELVCPLPEVKAHTHDESCYVTEIVNICGQIESEGHVHDASCYTMVSHPELICGQVESAGHVHSEACYTTTENTYLACGMVESAGHVHDESCYTLVVAEDGTETMELTCAIPESIGHVHSEACYITEPVIELTCTTPESAGHTHTEACWANVETMELTCGKEESAGHAHSDACYAEQTVLVCPQPEVIPHVHSDECYTVVGYAEDGSEIKELTCGMTEVREHVHTADCFTSYEMTVEVPHQHTELCYVQVLSCTLPEHEHTDECYVAPAEPEVSADPAYICGMAEHTHDAACYTTYIAGDGTETTELTCQLPEHTHDETCLPVIIDEVLPTAEPVEIVEDETPHFELPVLVCGLPEHEHSTNCMDENMVYVCGITQHTHSGECYDIPGMDVSPVLTCSLHEHFHTEACYNENGELACGLEEHTHTVGCFTLPEGVAEPEATEAPAPTAWCGKTEHTHDESCYDETGALICELEEHTHDETCFVEPTYYCGFTAHTHDESCMDANGEPVCGLPEHTHDASCLVEPTYYCGKVEHTHDESCYDETGALICELEEHTHDETCLIPPTYYCGMVEHTHDESCYDEAGNLICAIPEHIHDASCLIQSFFQMAEADGILVTAEYTSEAGIPEEAQLRVARFNSEEHYDHFVDRVNEANDIFNAANPEDVFQPMALLNIGFYLPNGAEVEPLAPVNVTVQLVGEDGLAAGEQYTLIHYADAGTELLDVESGSADQVAFTTESFSDFIIGNDEDPSDGGSTVADNEQDTGEPESTADGTESTGTVVDPDWAPFSSNYMLGSSYSLMSSSGTTAILNSNSSTEFEHHKTIDYLGDNQSAGGSATDGDNPDTTVDDKGGVTDDLYRIYLDMEGKSEPVDLLIVLDRSGSMFKDDRDERVAPILFGEDGKSGLIGKFLESNSSKAAKEDRNYVAMVWYAGAKAVTDKLSGDFRFSGKKISPLAASESGVSFSWTDTITGINSVDGKQFKYSFAGMIEGGTTDGQHNQSGSVATNYAAGFVQAHKMLDADKYKSTHKQVVIFISDGVPTLYYESKSFETALNSGNYDSLVREGFGADNMTVSDLDDAGGQLYTTNALLYNYVNESTDSRYLVNNKNTYKTMGQDVEGKYSNPKNPSSRKDNKVLTAANLKSIWHSPYFTETIECFQTFAAKHTDINFFTIGINMGENIPERNETTKLPSAGIGKFSRYDILDRMAQCYGDGNKAIRTDTSAELEKALRQIMFPSGVTISDELSQYVTLYDAQPDVLVTARNKTTDQVYTLWSGGKTGKTTTVGEDPTSYPVYGEAGNDNTNPDLGAGEKNIVDSVTYDGNVIAVHFREDYCLNKDFTYTLSFNVRLTEEAYRQFAATMNQRGVPKDSYTAGVEGDTGTDYKKNKTSSGEPGFFSNDKAVVTYTVDNQGYEAEYEKPVVQCWATKFVFTKTDDTGKPLEGVKFKLQKWNEKTGEWKLYKNSGYITPDDPDGDGWYLTDENGQIDFGYLGESGKYRLREWIPAQYENADKKVTWLTFTVKKGRIINAKAADGTWSATGVQWTDTNYDQSTSTSYSFNSRPNETYGAESSATVVNRTFRKELLILKKDDKGNNLAGATFSLEKKNTANEYERFPLEGETLDGWVGTTAKDGVVFKGKLPYGDYKLVEDDAPDFYERLTEGIEFKVDKDGVTITKNDTGNHADVVENDTEGFTLTFKDEPVEADWDVHKVDDSGANALEGAKFTLYGPYTAEETKAAGFTAPGDKKAWSFTTDSDGKALGDEVEEKPKLDARMVYYLVETEAPAGYNVLDGAIELTMTQTGDVLTLHASMLAAPDRTFGIEGTVDVKKPAGERETLVITVTNYTGYELPESGGMGTTIFYVSGLALTALAGAVLCARKRREVRG